MYRNDNDVEGYDKVDDHYNIVVVLVDDGDDNNVFDYKEKVW